MTMPCRIYNRSQEWYRGHGLAIQNLLREYAISNKLTMGDLLALMCGLTESLAAAAGVADEDSADSNS